MKIFCLFTFTICIFVQAIMCSGLESAGELDSKRPVLISEKTLEDLMNTLQKLQENQNYQNSRIAFLERLIKNQNYKIAAFQTRCSADNKQEGMEEEQHDPSLDRNKYGFTEFTQYPTKSYVKKTKASDTQINANNGVQVMNFENLQHKSNRIRKRDIGAAEHVAFSAYLNHVESHLTSRHIIKCDKILLNDGNAYNNFTGVFTAPTTGVYLLTFFFDSHSVTYLKIVIDGKNTVDAVADPETSQETMGGNTVILRITVGQSVWLEEYEASDGQTVGGESYRFTTFSGFLLY